MKLSAKGKGILFIILQAFCFSCMTVCVRMADNVPLMQKTFIRNFVALIVIMAVMLRKKEGIAPARKANLPLLFARAVLGTGALLCTFYAIERLTLADATVLNKMAPFFAVIASFFLLDEKLSPVQIVSLVGAFTGALLVIKPSSSILKSAPALIGMLGGLSAGVGFTVLRMLGKRKEKNTTIIFAFLSFSCLVALPFLIFDFYPMSVGEFFWLVAAGLCASGGQLGLTAAYYNAPAREISVFDYSSVIFSAGLGFFIFGDVPDVLSFAGYILILSMAFINSRFGAK